METIGEKLRYYRKKLGWTLQELEEKSGIANPSISRYETGKVIPRRENLEKLAQALGVDISNLLEVETKEEQKLETEQPVQDMKTFFRGLMIEISDMIPVPIFGTIPAGNPKEEESGVIDWIKMPKSIASQVDYALKVKGVSMIEAGITEDDLVFVKFQNYADDGNIVVAKKGNEYTIKRLKKTASESWLEPANHLFVFGKSEFEIVGKVKFVLKEVSK
jgi:repressor LexA